MSSAGLSFQTVRRARPRFKLGATKIQEVLQNVVVAGRNSLRHHPACLNHLGHGGRVPPQGKGWSKNTVFGYVFHGAFATLALWMFLMAVS
jgi:hypothetical protein